MGDLITSTRAARRLSAALLLAALSVVWTWWAIRQGAYFGAVFLPGTVLLAATVVALAFGAPWRVKLRLSKLVVTALVALVALGLLTMVSALWSPAPEHAIEDGQRVLAYAIVFVLGIWLCNLLGGFMQLSMVPLAVAGLVAGIATVAVTLGGSDASRFLEPDGTLDWPIGYRNANAAFFAIAAWPALGLAQTRHLHWVLRTVFAGSASLCIGIFILCQSRGSLLAAAVALLVYVLLSPERARALLYLAIAVVPALLVLTPASELYRTVNETGLDSLGTEAALNRAAQVALGAAIFAGLAGALFTYLDRSRRPASDRLRRSNLVTILAFGALAIGGIGALAVANGDPSGWIGDRIEELDSATQPEYGGEATRYSFDLSTPRPDLWRVAIASGTDYPLTGLGAGGFHYRYTRDRDTSQSTVHDAHNVFLEQFSELGLPGLLLLVTALAAMVLAALKARRLGPSAAALTAIALTVATYWLVHASLDWFWPYPALTAPVLALLGSAVAPRLLVPVDLDMPSRARLLLPVFAVVLALSTIPPYLAERYTRHAREVWQTQPQRAGDDISRAKSLNPLSMAPYVVEGRMARASGDTARAVEAFDRAIAKRPCEWEFWFQRGQVLAAEDPGAARESLETAAALNPLGREIRAALDDLPPAPAGHVSPAPATGTSTSGGGLFPPRCEAP